MSNFTENDVGMTEYIGKNEGFSGILKLRYQDFLVNEIDKKGNTLHITDLTKEDPRIATPQPTVKQEIVLNSTAVSLEKQQELHQLQDDELLASFVLIEAGKDKTKRTEIHQFIRQCFPQLDSETISDPSNDEKNIKVTKIVGRKRRFDASKRKREWTSFVLYKENISTMDAINLISKKLHLKGSRSFQFAGNKDKRAVTVQEMTTTLPTERIMSINKIFRNMKIGNFKTSQYQLQLGDLQGNRFSVVLRDIKGMDMDGIKSAVSSFTDDGFINYFGMQRFGVNETPTYEIGKALLASDWSKAVTLILSSALKDADTETQNLLKTWDEVGHASEAYSRLKRKASFEGYLLQGIVKHGPKQVVQALGKIPRSTRMLYLHSYQSYIWNRIVSKRMQLYGAVPVVGDMVLDDQKIAGVKSENSQNDELSSKKPRLTDDTEVSCEEDDIPRSLPNVKLLTPDELSSYDITDVLMPMPGHSVTYPGNNVKDWYQSIFHEDGLEMSCTNHKVKEYSLPGAYRRIVVRPDAVDWDVTDYTDFKKPLLLTDYDKVCGRTHLTEIKDGKFKALRIHFSLPTSSYATVAMRELCKRDMSVTEQSLLGEKHKEMAQKLSQANEVSLE